MAGPGTVILWEDRYPHLASSECDEDCDSCIDFLEGQGCLRQKRKEIGSIAYDKEQLCNPRSSVSSLFPSWLMKQNYDRNAVMVREYKGNFKVVTGWDIARSATTAADYLVGFTIGYDPVTKIRQVLNITREKGIGFDDQVAMIADHYRRYQDEYIIVEADMNQDLWVEQGKKKYPGIPVFSHYTRGKKRDLVNGVPGLLIPLENSLYRIPRGDRHSIEMTDIWAGEALSFGWENDKLEGVGEHDDCLRKGAMILTKKGYKKIEEIKIGESVLTHRGRWKKVTNKICKPFKGKLITIKPYGSPEIEVTEEHPILTTSKHERGGWDGFSEPKWLPAGEIVAKKDCGVAKHRLMFPMFDGIKEIGQIDLADYNDIKRNPKSRRHLEGLQRVLVEKTTIGFIGKPKIKRIINVNKDFGRFIGLFLAEGHVSRNCKQGSFAFNSNEFESIEFIKKMITSLGINYGITGKGNSTEITFSNYFLNKFLRSECYLENEKVISWRWLHEEPEIQKAVLYGWLEGDGTLNHGKWIGSTTSQILARQMWLFALRCGNRPQIYYNKRNRFGKKTKDLWNVRLGSINNFGWSRLHKEHLISTIENIKCSEIQENVYNIEVEDDESYIVEGIIVHNCILAWWKAEIGIKKLEGGKVYSGRLDMRGGVEY